MGQRLNIEIFGDGKTLANAYYHWSAYTDSALELTERIVQAYEDMRSETNKLKLAVKLLELTGAGVNDVERMRIEAAAPEFSGIEFKPAIDRTEGLLAVTRKGIEETRCWEEFRVVVDIDAESISFQVVWDYDSLEEYIEEYEEYKEYRTDAKFVSAEDFDFDDIPFEKLDELIKMYNEGGCGVKFSSGKVVTWIQ